MAIMWNVCISVFLVIWGTYADIVVSCTHELINACGLYVAFEGQISFGHIQGDNMFPVTWCWRCYQWHHCIYHVEMFVQKYWMTFYVSVSSGTVISVICNWWYHWNHDADATGITWPKMSCCTSFQSYWPKELMISLAPLDASASANGIRQPKRSCCMSFWSSWCKECNGTTDSAVGMIWCQHQWHYMTNKVILHLIPIILAYRMWWCHWQCCWHHMMPMAVVSHDQKVMLHHIWLFWPKGWNGAIGNTIDMMQMLLPAKSHDQKIILHLILIIHIIW